MKKLLLTFFCAALVAVLLSSTLMAAPGSGSGRGEKKPTVGTIGLFDNPYWGKRSPIARLP